MLDGVDQRLEVCQRVVEPPAERAEDHDLVKALPAGEAHGGHGVRVVLFGGEAAHRDVLGDAAAVGVEIADDEVGPYALGRGVGVAPVAGDDEVAGPDAGEGMPLPAGEDDASAGHGEAPFVCVRDGRGDKPRARLRRALSVERMMGVEPTLSAWEAGVLPMNYIRISHIALLLYHIIR